MVPHNFSFTKLATELLIVTEMNYYQDVEIQMKINISKRSPFL